MCWAIVAALQSEGILILATLAPLYGNGNEIRSATAILLLTLFDFHVHQPLCSVLSFAGAADLLVGAPWVVRWGCAAVLAVYCPAFPADIGTRLRGERVRVDGICARSPGHSQSESPADLAEARNLHQQLYESGMPSDQTGEGEAKQRCKLQSCTVFLT